MLSSDATTGANVGEWYDALSGIQKVLFLTGAFSTVIFLIQLMLTFVGLDDNIGDSDDGIAFGDIFTIRNGVSFLMGFSWGGLMAYGWGLESAIGVAFVGFVIGSTFVGVNMLLMFGLAQLKHDGAINLNNAIDQTGTVTLPIPANRTGVGKVMVAFQGRLKELHAITDGDQLARHTEVIVRDTAGSQLVVGRATTE